MRNSEHWTLEALGGQTLSFNVFTFLGRRVAPSELAFPFLLVHASPSLVRRTAPPNAFHSKTYHFHSGMGPALPWSLMWWEDTNMPALSQGSSLTNYTQSHILALVYFSSSFTPCTESICLCLKTSWADPSSVIACVGE